MITAGFAVGLDDRDTPVGSEELCDLTYELYAFVIRAFGPGGRRRLPCRFRSQWPRSLTMLAPPVVRVLERCMFESNFPVDKWGVGYRVLWNTFKRVAARMALSDEEKKLIFHDTAAKVYSV